MSSKGVAGRDKARRTKAVSRSRKAGLQFPVGRIARFLKFGRYAERIGAASPVFMAAVLEYLTAEVRTNSVLILWYMFICLHICKSVKLLRRLENLIIPLIC